MYLYVFIDVKIKIDLYKFIGFWLGVIEWVYLMIYYYYIIIGLNFFLGYIYRFFVKFCVRFFCFVFINSNGVIVLVNNFIIGVLIINY